MGHLDEKYGKFAYSSKFGFSVRKANDSIQDMAPDNELVFEINGLFFGRGVSRTEVSETDIMSYWSPFKGIDIRTELKISDYSYSAKHIITSEISCTAYSCGFAIPRDAAGYREDFNNVCANVLTNMGGCEVDGGPGLIIGASPNTNLLYPRTSIPAVKYSIVPGENVITSYVRIFP